MNIFKLGWRQRKIYDKLRQYFNSINDGHKMDARKMAQNLGIPWQVLNSYLRQMERKGVIRVENEQEMKIAIFTKLRDTNVDDMRL